MLGSLAVILWFGALLPVVSAPAATPGLDPLAPPLLAAPAADSARPAPAARIDLAPAAGFS